MDEKGEFDPAAYYEISNNMESLLEGEATRIRKEFPDFVRETYAKHVR